MNNLDDYRGRLLARAFYDELEKLSADAQGLSTGDKGAWAGSSHLSKPQGIQINPVTPPPKPPKPFTKAWSKGRGPKASYPGPDPTKPPPAN